MNHTKINVFELSEIPFLYPAHFLKWRGIKSYSPNRLSVRPSVFEWFGIANDLIAFINNRAIALD